MEQVLSKALLHQCGNGASSERKLRRTLVSEIAPAPIAAIELAEADGSVHKSFCPLVIEVAGALLRRFDQEEPVDVVTTLLAPVCLLDFFVCLSCLNGNRNQ